MRLLVLALTAAIAAVIATEAYAQQAGPSHVIPPGQEALIARMLGAEATAGCARTDRVIESEHIAADYRCGAATVRVFLAHASAGVGVVTGRFAITADADTPGARALVAEVAARVRAGEAEFSWIAPSEGVRNEPPVAERSPPPWTGEAPASRDDRSRVAGDHHGRARDHGHWIAGAVLLVGAALFAAWVLRRRRDAGRPGRG